MYKYKIFTESTKSEEHIKEITKKCIKFTQWEIDFNKPWKFKELDLTEEDWTELNEKGSLEKTIIEKTTIFIEKTCI